MYSDNIGSELVHFVIIVEQRLPAWQSAAAVLDEKTKTRVVELAAPPQELQEFAVLLYVVQQQHFFANPSDEKQKVAVLSLDYVAECDALFENIGRRTNKVEVQIDELLDVLHVGLCRHRGLLVYEVHKHMHIRELSCFLNE